MSFIFLHTPAFLHAYASLLQPKALEQELQRSKVKRGKSRLLKSTDPGDIMTSNQ